MKQEEITGAVREGYGKMARKDNANSASASFCCGGTQVFAQDIREKIGYGEDVLEFAPEGANLGDMCGRSFPQAPLKTGDVALVLGFRAGFNYPLAAKAVGRSGKVMGVDMNPKILDRAREYARKGNYENVEFRLGEIENLPMADNLVNIIISNCMINLYEDKKRVFREAFRVLRPWGRLMVSEIVLLKGLSEEIKNSVTACIGYLAKPVTQNEYLQAMQEAGFQETRVIDEGAFPAEAVANDPTARAIFKIPYLPREKAKDLSSSVASIKVSAVKPPFKWMSAYLNHWLG
jgi:arsenite methyltransferase